MLYKARSCEVPETHKRAMKLKDFLQLGELVEKVVAKYKHTDKCTGQAVRKDTVNLYHINDLIVMPLTGPCACSFMEMVSSGPQDPVWFISHWWGTPFLDTLRMMRLHADRRHVSMCGLYWMCTFANNQHNLAELSEPGILDTPFAKAIMSESCIGTVAFLDEEKASPFSRIWCILEDYVTIHFGAQKKKTQLMDFCTIIPEGECESSCGTTNPRCAGILIDNGDGTSKDNGSDLANSAAAWFPGGVSVKAVRLDVTKAQATKENDRANILRLIRGKEDDVNLAIQTRFAPSAAYMAATDIASREGTNARFIEIVERGLLGGEEEWPRLLGREGAVADCAEYVDSCKGNLACLKFMLEHMCDPNRCSEDGPSPLENAFVASNWEAARLLLKHGADPLKEKPDDEGHALPEDVFGSRKRRCPEDVKQMLRERGYPAV